MPGTPSPSPRPASPGAARWAPSAARLAARTLLGLTALLLGAALAPLGVAQADPPTESRLHLPALAKGHPIARCPKAISQARAIEIAFDEADFYDFGPPPGHDQPVVERAELLTAEEADARYNLSLTSNTPAYDPWVCVWWLELDGRAVDRFGPPPGPTPVPTPGQTPRPTSAPMVFVTMELAILAEDGFVTVLGLYGPPFIVPTATPATTATPGPSPTADPTPTTWPTPTARPTPLSGR
ncbi:MAG: hypothetical protein H6648_07360 [Caldilineae bacterium]|nr:hypothetical protein [Caldilineae bacterium]